MQAFTDANGLVEIDGFFRQARRKEALRSMREFGYRIKFIHGREHLFSGTQS